MDGARLCGEVLADFDRFLATALEQTLNLAEAAAYSGYSPDHLRRLARDGKIALERRGRRLFFRVADLPQKAGIADPTASSYDPDAHARQVAFRGSHGGNS